MARGKKDYKKDGSNAPRQTSTSQGGKMGFSVSDSTEPGNADASTQIADSLDRKLMIGGTADPQSGGTQATQSGEGHSVECATTSDASRSEEHIDLGNDRGKRISGAQRRRRNRERNAVLRGDDGLSYGPLTSDSIKHIASTFNQGAAAKGEDNSSILSESTMVSLGRSVSVVRGENDYEIISRLQHSPSGEPSDIDVTYVPRATRADHRSNRRPRVSVDVPQATEPTPVQTEEPARQEPAPAQTEPSNPLDDSWETKDVMLEGQRLSRKLKGVTEEIERHTTARAQACEQIRAAQEEIARLTRAVAAETAAIERKEKESKADRARLLRAHQILGLD
jgi:hypothetical protein